MIKQICTLLFKIGGWKFVNTVPCELRSFVLVGAPHTSNHDFITAMAVSHLMQRNAKFVIKSEWLKFPFNIFLKPIGAYGLDRSKLAEKDRLSNVELMAQLFEEFHELVLMISPEGTRSPNSRWKTGFYYIAVKARLPIVLGFVDYAKKEAGMGMVIWPSDFETDMRAIMQFYENKEGKIPEKFLLDSRFLSK